MWVAILGGLIVYGIFKLFFSGDDDVMEVETSDFNAIFAVATRVEKLFGGKAYAGLRIPDADTGSRQNIDLVVVTKEELLVISVKNLSGFVSINSDGSWVCDDGKHKAKTLPNPFQIILLRPTKLLPQERHHSRKFYSDSRFLLQP